MPRTAIALFGCRMGGWQRADLLDCARRDSSCRHRVGAEKPSHAQAKVRFGKSYRHTHSLQTIFGVALTRQTGSLSGRPRRLVTIDEGSRMGTHSSLLAALENRIRTCVCKPRGE